MLTLAFDVYGTLIDPHGLLNKLEQLIGTNAVAFSSTWRYKQLEYSFRRGLMGQYAPFSTCTRQALEYTCAYYAVDMKTEQKEDLLQSYRTLPAYSDVQTALSQLQESGFQLYAFSNGEPEALETLLAHAGIIDRFLGVISVDGIQSFKPNPDVYHYFLNQTKSAAETTWMISCNPFDVIGAISIGMKSAWVRRTQTATFDPWGIDPTLTVSNLLELDAELPRLQ